MTSFVSCQGLVKIRLVYARALLLNISSSNIITHSNDDIKGDKYFFFIKVVGAANVLWKLNYLYRQNTEKSNSWFIDGFYSFFI